MEALRNRIARHGVNIVTAKPGFIDTAMLDHLEKKPKGLLLTPAPKAAAIILDAARRGGSPTVFVPRLLWPIVMVLRHMPSFVFRRLNI
jgi:NAD(P)-dependent dehydrogenase (short-subunit alcohol dehydrogenase family)